MIKVNLRTPPEATPKPNPNPKSNDKTDEPKKKPIDAAHTPVSTPAKAIPGANTDLKITGANTDLKTIAKITLDPPITAHPILPAPSPPQHAPHNIQNVPVAASPTLLTITSPVSLSSFSSWFALVGSLGNEEYVDLTSAPSSS